eukprot:5479009-Amphidinium_carterae.1
MEKGTHWELGRWAHHLLPFEGGLHIFNVYGYSSDKERAQELNREVCLEIFAAVAALGNRQIFILGDWNFEPDDFPIDLVHGGQVNRPLSEVTHTSPTGEQHLDWILCSKGYRGQRRYETAERVNVDEVAVEYARAKREHLTGWSTALATKDVDQLWDFWCRAAEKALGLPAYSRGRLVLTNQQLLEKVPDDEAVASATQQDTVANLKRKLLDTGACTFFEWPTFLGTIPPTAAAQLNALDAWVTSRKQKLRTERTASWRAY